jgi:hypothetical protein
MQSLITPDELSIVFQGPVFGKRGEPEYMRFTKIAVASARQYYPGAELILSTWEEYATREYLEDIDIDALVVSKDPGAFHRKDNPLTLNNVNRMIVSSVNGLGRAARRYAIKTRSDVRFLHGRGVLHFGRFREADRYYKVLDEKVCVSNRTTINPRRLYPLPYHICDWYFLGLRSDLIEIFNIELSPEPLYTRWFESRKKPANDFDPANYSRYMAEDYVWSTFLKKKRKINHEFYCDISPAAIEESERFIANNLIVLSNVALGIEALKYPGYCAPHLLKCYTWREWQKLYALHAGGRPVAGWDAELAINFSAHWLHRAVSPLFPLARPVVRAWRQLRRRMHAPSASRF